MLVRVCHGAEATVHSIINTVLAAVADSDDESDALKGMSPCAISDALVRRHT